MVLHEYCLQSSGRIALHRVELRTVVQATAVYCVMGTFSSCIRFSLDRPEERDRERLRTPMRLRLLDPSSPADGDGLARRRIDGQGERIAENRTAPELQATTSTVYEQLVDEANLLGGDSGVRTVRVRAMYDS